MFTQLSLFDSAISSDSSAASNRLVVFPSHRSPAAPAQQSTSPRRTARACRGGHPSPASVSVACRGGATTGEAEARPTVGEITRQIEKLDQRRPNELQPMGDLAKLVLARYDLMAQRRRELEARRRQQPRKSIRVLSPVAV
jgi:hypothetical protein